MSLEKKTSEETKKHKKNQPGDERTPGSKDYSVILGNLIHYKHQLVQENDEQKIGALIAKIAEKLKELGFCEESEKLKTKLGRRKQGKFQNITTKKKDDTVNLAIKHYAIGKQRNEEAKQANQLLKKAERLQEKAKQKSEAKNDTKTISM